MPLAIISLDRSLFPSFFQPPDNCSGRGVVGIGQQGWERIYTQPSARLEKREVGFLLKLAELFERVAGGSEIGKTALTQGLSRVESGSACLELLACTAEYG